MCLRHEKLFCCVQALKLGEDKKNEIRRGLFTGRRSSASQANGDITTNYRKKVNGCSGYTNLKRRGYMRNIYLADQSQANEVLEFVAMLKAELTKA